MSLGRSGTPDIVLLHEDSCGIRVEDPHAVLPSHLGPLPYLVSINGKSLKGLSFKEIKKLLHGPIGSVCTLELVDAILASCELVSLVRVASHIADQPERIQATLRSALNLLDSYDGDDLPGEYLVLASACRRYRVEPLTLALYECALKTSRNWLTPNSLVALLTSIEVAEYFDSVGLTDRASDEIDVVLCSSNCFASLDFTDYGLILNFVRHLYATRRTAASNSLFDVLLIAAQNSSARDARTIEVVKLKIDLLLKDKSDFHERSSEIESFIDLLVLHSQAQPRIEDLLFAANSYADCGYLPKAVAQLARANELIGMWEQIANTSLKRLACLALYKIALGYIKCKQFDSAVECLYNVQSNYRKLFAEPQLTIVEKLPAFGPRASDIELRIAEVDFLTGNYAQSISKLENLLVQLHAPSRTLNICFREVYSMLASNFQALGNVSSHDLYVRLSKALETLPPAGTVEEHEQPAHAAFVFLIDEGDFEKAKKMSREFFEIFSSKDCDFLSYIDVITEQAIFSSQLDLNLDYSWGHLQEIVRQIFSSPILEAADLQDSPTDDSVLSNIELYGLRMWAQCYVQIKEYDRARIILERAKSLLASSIDTLNMDAQQTLLGLINVDLKIVETKQNCKNSAFIELDVMELSEINSSSAKKYVQLCASLIELKKLDEADDLANQLILLSPDFSAPLPKDGLPPQQRFELVLVKILFLKGSYNQAAKILADALPRSWTGQVKPAVLILSAAVSEVLFEFDVAARRYYGAQKFFAEVSTRNYSNYLMNNSGITNIRAQLNGKALQCAAKTKVIFAAELATFYSDLAESIKFTDRQSAIFTYLRALELVDAKSMLSHTVRTALANLNDMYPAQTQRSALIRFAEQSEEAHLSRSPYHWIDVASSDLDVNEIELAIKRVDHAIELFQRGERQKGLFIPLLQVKQNSVIRRLISEARADDAHRLLLKFADATKVLYGEFSEEWMQALVEIAYLNFDLNLWGEISKHVDTMLDVYHRFTRPDTSESSTQPHPAMSRLFELATSLVEVAQHGLSLSIASKILATERGKSIRNSSDSLRALMLTARLSKLAGYFEDAVVYYSEGYRQLKNCSSAIRATMLQDISDYAQTLRSLGRNEEADAVKLGAAILPSPSYSATQEYISKVQPLFDMGESLEQDGQLKQAQEFFLKGVEVAKSIISNHVVVFDAASKLGGFYTRHQHWGKAGETYLELIRFLDKSAPLYSSRKVSACLLLARTYVRLNLTHEIPDLIAQAKAVDPEVNFQRQTLENSLNYAGVEMEANLLSAALEDMIIASKIAEQKEFFLSDDEFRLASEIFALTADLKNTELSELVLSLSSALRATELCKKQQTESANEEAAIVSEHGRSKDIAPSALLERLRQNALDDCNNFLSDLASKIESEWYPPKNGGDKVLQISFKILKDGTIDGVETIKSSGDKYVDAAAQEAILNVNGVLPLPDPKVDFEEFCLHVNAEVSSPQCNFIKIIAQD